MTQAQPTVKAVKTAITPTRADNYPEWYQQVIKGADMAEMSGVRGCMVIKPWGYGMWENLVRELDTRFKDTNHENAYFPLFIPLSLIAKEAEHVEGFAKEMAVVTHHRVALKDGKMQPDGALDEPLVVRPTSETIIGEAFARWIKSYRDLPVLINQWANVVRWEMRPRIFLRTAEFLWQEGHTAHANEAEARVEVDTMLNIYAEVCEDVLAFPVIKGEKTPHERFPGAVTTLCIEAMMQDGKSLQAGTSHYLGQNFAKAANVSFQNKEGQQEFAYTTSWGASTRLIGGVIMTHSDDDGLRVPPSIAPQQVMIVPIYRDEADKERVLAFCDKVVKGCKTQVYNGQVVRAKVDTRDLASADKRWQWIKKGVPLILEIGPRDVDGNAVALTRRHALTAKKDFVPFDQFISSVSAELGTYHTALYNEALAVREARTIRTITSLEEFKAYFGESGENSFNTTQGYVHIPFCGDEAAVEPLLKSLGVTIRCIPAAQPAVLGACVLTGKPAAYEAIFARSY